MKKCANISSFVIVAIRAGKGKVTFYSLPAMLEANNVIEMECIFNIFLSNSAIFATIPSAVGNFYPEGFRKYGFTLGHVELRITYGEPVLWRGLLYC